MFQETRKHVASGLSLVEIIVTIGLIAMTLLSYFMVLKTTALTRLSQRQTLAYQIALKKVEELKSLPLSALPASGFFSDTALSALPQASANLIIGDYAGSTQIKEVEIIIIWQEANGQKEVKINTLLTEGGI